MFKCYYANATNNKNNNNTLKLTYRVFFISHNFKLIIKFKLLRFKF